MASTRCCVPGCNVTQTSSRLHRFPNPDHDPERFNKWLHTIGGNLLSLNFKTIYYNRKVCRCHFEKKFHVGNKLTRNAVPNLNIQDTTMSNIEKRSKIPSAPTFNTSGNLLSNVAPPSQLPNFVTTTTSTVSPVSPAESDTIAQQNLSQISSIPLDQLPPSLVKNEDCKTEQKLPESPEKFSPAIPLSKGEPTLPIRSPEDSLTTLSPESLPESTPEMEKIGDVMPGSGIFTWMKGAVSGGGLLQKVAEKAKSSVDSMITTLDPQMKEYLKIGGDVIVVVASDNIVKISAVREAFQTVFGKATVIGQAAQSQVTAAQPVGYAAAYAAAKQRVAQLRADGHLANDVPIVAVEGFVQETIADRWYDMSLLVLSQPSLGAELQLQSQGCPLPPAVLAAARAASRRYEHEQTGYSVTVGSIMAANLKVPHSQWQEASTGVSRREILLLAARSLAGSYKKLLAVSAAEV